MKVLLVQSWLCKKVPVVFPLGLAYIAAMLTKHEVKMLDLNICEKPYEDLKDELLRFSPEVIGISLRNIDSQHKNEFDYFYNELTPTLEVIKKVMPNSIIIIGGSGYSMFPRKIIERHTEIDFGVYLEGEETLSLLLDNLNRAGSIKNVYFRENGKVLFSGKGRLPDLAVLPIPRKDLVDIKKYAAQAGSIGVQTKRGCPFKCSYCNYPVLNGNQVRMRNPVQIVDEIEELVSKYKIDTFMFADGVFSSPKEHAIAICNEIIKRKVTVKWHAWCDVKDITEEFLSAVTEAGCTYINISPDALSDDALTGLNKGIRENDVWRSYSLLKNTNGIRFGMGFFVNTPGETLKGFFKTLFFFLKANICLKLSGSKGGVGIGWIRIEPDTRIYDMSVEQGVIKKDTDLLPPTDKEYKKLFYTKPNLKFLDPLVAVVLFPLKLKKLIFKVPNRIE